MMPTVRAMHDPGVAAVAERVRDASDRGAPLRIVAGATWLDAGRPSTGEPVSLTELRGIVDYVPGDLTITARAGTTLDELARTTGAEGQWIPLDPFGPAGGTLGATIATASAGPLAQAFGPPRDNVLGVELVLGTGEVIRAGGRVVKNVAGFDLTRLTIGAWGTLGIITEATLRLRALPAAEITLALALPEADEAIHATLEAVRRAPLAALALETVNATLAARLRLERRELLLARIGGNAESVATQSRVLRGLGDAEELPCAIWDALRAAEPARAQVVRLSAAPSGFGRLWIRCRERLADVAGTMLHGSAGRGIVRVVVPDEQLDVAAALSGLEATAVIGERLAPASWPVLCPTAADARLARGVRAAFDPERILNRGILGESAA